MVTNYEELIKFGNDELFVKGNFKIVEEIFAVDYVVHSGGKDYSGRKFIKKIIKQLRTAIPDIHVTDVKFLTHADDIVAWQRTLSGTHKANLMGISPTRQKVEWREMMITRFQDEKNAEEWMVSELLGELLSKSPYK